MGIYTKFAGMALTALGVVALSGGVALAEPDNKELIINGTKINSKVKAPESSPFETLISGWHYRKVETQVMEEDDFDNPSQLSIALGEELWVQPTGSEGKSCSTCHDKAEETMKGVRATMPKWDESRGRPITLEQQINKCRTERMGAKKLKFDNDTMLGYSIYVGMQSRGMPVNVDTSGPMASWAEKGKKIYYTRLGQLDLSCANCHENNNGNYIRADHLSQGHSNGFPLYRLKWQKAGSLHRRFKGCVKNIRGKPYKIGSDEAVALEIYVGSRGNGLAVETPAVRQ